MSTIQQLVDQLGSGWKVVGNGTPIEETVVAQIPNDAVPGTTQTVNRGTGNYYVTVQDPDGHQRALFMKAQPIKGGLEVRQSGINDQGDNAKNIYTGDLKNLQWDQSKPVGDVPGQTVKPTADLNKWIKIDQDGNDATKTGKPPVYLVDPADASNKVPIPKDPAGTVTKVGSGFYVIKPDGSGTPVTDDAGNPVTEATKPDVYNVPGIGLVQVDPTKPAGQNATTLVATPKGMTAKDLGSQATKNINGQVWVASDGPDNTITWSPAKDTDGNPLPADVTWTTASNDPRSKYIQLIGSDGSSKLIEKPPDWKPPPSPQAGQALTPDTVAPYIVTIGDDGKPVFTDNRNSISISDATRQMIEGLGYHVAAGTMTEGQAQELIKSITSQMTAQASMQNAQANTLNAGVNAATGITQAATQGAQAGANLLNQRAQTAQQAITDVTGILGRTQKGLIAGVPSDFGANLVQGAQGWATQLMGGEDVAQAAANMVRNADPTNASGLASQGYAALQQMLQKYKDLTGNLHPLGQQANAQAAQGTGGTGFTSPVATSTPAATTPVQNPSPSLSSPNQVAGQNYGADIAYTGGVPPWLAGQPQPQPVPQPTAVASGSPYLSYPNQIPGANYGASVYVPGSGFVAPGALPTLPGTPAPVALPTPAARVTAQGVA